jgi:uncharacterized protein YidB (DUF937 family)
MPRCVLCKHDVRTGASFCAACGEPQTSEAKRQASKLSLVRANRFVRPTHDIPIHSAPRGAKTSYFASHIHTYGVKGEDQGWLEIYLGAGHTGWLDTKRCTAVTDLTRDLSAPIPCFLVPDGSTYSWATYERMPLELIPCEGSDYRLMYHWIGNAASTPPAVKGRVQQLQQTGTRTVTYSHAVRQSDDEVTSQSVTQSVNTYQLMIEESSGVRRIVMIERPVQVLPQIGDYLAVWGAVATNGICTLAQAVRRDPRQPSQAQVLVPLAQETLKQPFQAGLALFVALAVILVLAFLIIVL